MASKILNKLGVGKKHKSVDLDPTPFTEHTVIQQIKDCVEYSLPPDCESSDGVYREPIDSLNTISSTSSTHSRATKDTSDSDPNTLPKSISSADSEAAGQSNTIGISSETAAEQVTLTAAMEGLAIDTQPPSMHMPSVDEQLPTDGSRAKEDNADSSADDDAFAVYMNDSQIKAAKAATNKPRIDAVPKLTPDVDPRNAGFPAAGNEYESPWDLESEISEVVKQMQNPTSPLATTPPHSMASSRVDNIQPTSATSTISKSRVDPVHGYKVDYDSMSGPSHKVKQPNAHRQSPGIKSAASPPVGLKPGVGAVLVEGEWREAKSNVSLASPSSPELTSPPQIISQPLTRSGSNAATNYIYDKGNASDIKVMLRYAEEKPKVPCAQPRISLSTSPHNDDDKLYENMSSAKKGAYTDTDGVYDDPWNVEQVQQEIFDQLERQKQKSAQHESRQRRASEDLSGDRTQKSDIFAVPQQLKRLTELPSESSSMNRSVDSSARRLLSSSSTSSAEVTDKLSPRAFPTGSIKSSNPPQIPQSVPGQLHTKKPVLVVHKTNGAFVNSHERRGSLTGTRSGSIKKTPSTPSDGPECQHRVGLTVNKSLPLTQQPWYHGSIQRWQAEDLLVRQPDGSFLIRDSSNSPRDKTLSLKNLSGFIHIKISQQPDGTVVLGQFSHPFRSIMEMVEYYSRHKVNIKGAEHTYLEIPVLQNR